MEHTKGKWTVANSGGQVVLGGMQHPKVITTLETVPLKITLEVEANAHLIAAAPELLAACGDFIAGWGHFCDTIDFSNSALDAEAIRFMNEVPGKIQQAVAATKGD